MSTSARRFSTIQSVIIAATIFAAVSVCLPLCQAQVAVQLPTFQVFSVQTTVMVPDGGTMSLGSIGRGSMGATSRGVPLLGSAPGWGRPFRNRAVGSSTSAGNVSVSAQIISLREIEGPLLAEGNRRLASKPYATAPDVQRRAAFLLRHVGQAKSASGRGETIRR